MADEKRSGHFRLKQALILRDALAAELGLDLSKAMPQLYHVEDNAGALRALDEGRYLEALAALCLKDKSRLAHLNGLVQSACGRAKLAPRYAQYLALLLFAHWHESQQDDREAFLARLNGWLVKSPLTPLLQRGGPNPVNSGPNPVNSGPIPVNSEPLSLPPFSEDDLQMAAF